MQSAHAVMEASQAFYDPQTSQHPFLVLTTVCDEKQLSKWANKLNRLDIAHKVWREPDLGNTITSIASEQVFGEQRKFFRDLQLLKKETCYGS